MLSPFLFAVVVDVIEVAREGVLSVLLLLSKQLLPAALIGNPKVLRVVTIR